MDELADVTKKIGEPMTGSTVRIGRGVVMINPGTDALGSASEFYAVENMRHFAIDCNYEGLKFIRIPAEDYGEGRFAFLLWHNTRCHEIQMPGWPLERVRFMGNDGQNPFEFPRLYLDGSSWLWTYAILDKEEDWKLIRMTDHG